MSIPINKVLEIINKHKDLEKDLSATNLDSKSYAKKSKEYSDLNEVVNFAKEFKIQKNKLTSLLEKSLGDTRQSNQMKKLKFRRKYAVLQTWSPVHGERL